MKFLLLPIVILFTAFLRAQTTTVSPLEFSRLSADSSCQKLDVRSGFEFELVGHIRDFKNINLYSKQFLPTVLQTFDKKEPILVTCFSGHRSKDAVKILINAGFDRVIELKGGIIAWIEAGFPLE